TGKLHLIEVLPFLAILWGLTTTFGITGAAAAWSLRTTVDALALFWAAGMPRRDVLFALRPAVLLGASGIAAHFIGGNWGVALLVGSFAGAASMAFAYAFSEEWARFLTALYIRARGLGDSLMRSAP